MNRRKLAIILISILSLVIIAGALYHLNSRFHFLADEITSSDWAIYPDNSSDRPIISPWIDVEIKNLTQGAEYYKISSVGSVTSPDQWIDKSGQQIQLSPSVKKGTISLKLSAWSKLPENGGQLIKEYTDIVNVDYDLSFSNLANQFNITAKNLDNGDIKLKAVLKNPDDPVLSLLAADIQSYVWMATAASDQTKILYPVYTNIPEYTIPLSSSQTVYIRLGAYNRVDYDEHGLYAANMVTAGYITVAIKKEDDTIPVINTAGTPFSNNIFISDKAIPGDMKMPLRNDSVTFFSGGMLSMQTNYNPTYSPIDPLYIEIDLPVGVNLNQSPQETTDVTTQFSDVSSGAVGLASGYHRYRIQKKKDTGKLTDWGSYGIIKIFPTFSDSLIGQKDLKMRIRVLLTSASLARTDIWQEQPLTLAGIPQLQLPKRLVTSFPFIKPEVLLKDPGNNANTDVFLSLYKKLGFNMVISSGLSYRDPTTNPPSPYLYTPEQRKAAPWQDLKFAQDDSLFFANYSRMTPFCSLVLGTYKDFKDTQGNLITDTNFDDWASNLTLSQFNTQFKTQLTDASFETERTKWKNAIDYNIATRRLDNNNKPVNGTGKLDMAYDGIFIQSDLVAIKNQMAISKPEYLSLDFESFPSVSAWMDNISKSANAEARRKAGETDTTLASRVIDEFTAGFTGAIRENSPDTKIYMYWYNAANGSRKYSWPITWDLMQKYKIIPAPENYADAVNLDQMGARMRANRLVMPKGYEMIPWISPDAYNVKKSPFMFDEVVHTFLNGATGFSVYIDSVNDMAHVLDMSRAIELLSPHEDLIIDGDVAFGDVSGTTNATVSAMKKDGQYLIGVTPKDSTKAVSFTINTGKNQDYVLTDEQTGIAETISGQGIHVSKVFAAGTVLSLTPKAEISISSLIDSLNLIEGQVITTNPYIISLKLKSPSDTTKVSKVEFYIDNTLISTATLPDVSGTYEAVWDTSKYHSTVKVIVYNADGTSEELTRNTTVNLSSTPTTIHQTSPIISILPKTGENSSSISIIEDYLMQLLK